MEYKKDEVEEKIREYMNLYNADYEQSAEMLTADFLSVYEEKLKEIEEKEKEIEKIKHKTITEILEILADMSPHCKKNEYCNLPKLK